jgi:hypothetical protein
MEDLKNEVTLKEARFDVFKFGIKGLNKDEQQNAKVQLAIKLGAKVRASKLFIIMRCKLKRPLLLSKAT